MYNPKYDTLATATAENSLQYTTFKDLASGKTYELLIEPSERSYAYAAEYSKLNVIGTAQPLLAYKSSECVLSFPDVKFWTYSNNKDLTPVLSALASLTQPVKDTLEPPVCKMSIGVEVWERVRVSKFVYKVRMHKGGVPVMAEGSLDLLIDPVPPKLTTFVDPAKVPMKLSPSEQSANAKKIRLLLEGDPVKAKQYNYTKGTSIVIVADDGKVTVDDKEIGMIKDILGTATPLALNTPQLTTAANKPKAPTPTVQPTVTQGMM